MLRQCRSSFLRKSSTARSCWLRVTSSSSSSFTSSSHHILRQVGCIVNASLFPAGDYERGVDHLTNAIAVCGQPQQLLQVLQQTLPPPVFQMLLTKLPTISQVCVCVCVVIGSAQDTSVLPSSCCGGGDPLWCHKRNGRFSPTAFDWVVEFLLSFCICCVIGRLDICNVR